MHEGQGLVLGVLPELPEVLAHMTKLTLALTVALAAARGATIDSGVVLTRPYFVSDDTTAFVNLSSTDGNFSLFTSGILGGANLSCLHESGTLDCPFGPYSIQAFFPDASSHSAQAAATINGIPFGTVLLGCGVSGCPDTFLRLTAQPVDILAPGDFEVPFSLSGQIQAAQSLGSSLLLDQTVSGIGLLDFSVTAASPGRFQINPGGTGGQLGLRWTFEPVPEPSMFLPVLLGLAAIQWRRRRKVGLA